ncbi:MAG: hypothetical protein WDZ45_09200 [Flavobacteriaceae bacterium]
MSKITLTTFVYPLAVPYLGQLINCINNQTVLPDEVLVFNDGLLGAESYFEKLNIDFKIIEACGSPFKIRTQAFEYLEKNNTDIIVFQDSDDLMQQNRIEVVEKKLNRCDMVVNDLSFMNQDGELYCKNIWEKRLPNDFTFEADFISNKNIVGLGNTSILKKSLQGFQLKLPKTDLIVADWFIFFQLMFKKKIKAIFTSETTTFYRQYSENISTMSENNKQRIEKNLEIKQQHYLALQSIGYNVTKYLNDLKTQKSSTINEPHLFWWE